MFVEILIALIFRFRLMTTAQSAALTRQCLAETLRAVRKLERAGWLEMRTILVEPPRALASPLATWTPGQPPIPFDSLSHRLLIRSQSLPVERTVLFATRKAARAYGGIAPDRSRPMAYGHDLMMVEAFFAIRDADPERAETWIGEDCWRRERQSIGFVPDAMTTSRGVATAVEYGGAYSPRRLMKIHAACKALSLPYEIW